MSRVLSGWVSFSKSNETSLKLMCTLPLLLVWARCRPHQIYDGIRAKWISRGRNIIIPRHYGAHPPRDGSPEVGRGEVVDPAGLVVGVIPEDVVTADGNAMLGGKVEHGIRDRVVLFALGFLSAVPLHLVLECGDSEPWCEPVLVCDIVEDVLVYGCPEWEGCFVLGD